MKKLLLSFIILALYTNCAFGFSENPVKILSANSGILYLKFGRSIQGGTIEIKDENGKVVFLKPIHENRLLVDFHFFKPGKYIVTISKEEFIETFSYTSAEQEPGENVGMLDHELNVGQI
jgi:hypothetical protein